MPCDANIAFDIVHKFTWHCQDCRSLFRKKLLSCYLIVSRMSKSWHGAGARRAVAKRSHFFTPRSQLSGPLQASTQQLTLELVDNTSVFSAQGAENISKLHCINWCILENAYPKSICPENLVKQICGKCEYWVSGLVALCLHLLGRTFRFENHPNLHPATSLTLQEGIHLLCLVMLYVVQTDKILWNFRQGHRSKPELLSKDCLAAICHQFSVDRKFITSARSESKVENEIPCITAIWL